MPTSTSVSAAQFPQTSDNRTIGEAKTELTLYTGGQDRADMLNRAGTAYRRAVREFNDVPWKFNRMTDDLTLVAATATYTLENDFRDPMRAVMVDGSGYTRDEVCWVPYEEWVHYLPDQSTTGSIPLLYTIRNAHETGILTVDPVPATTMTYPTLRVHYHRRIEIPQGDNERVNAPVEVEEAIFARALSIFIAMVRTHREAGEYNVEARINRQRVEIEHRDWEDF